MKWYCKPHRTGRKQRKLGHRTVKLDKTISIKCRALGHTEDKWFDQSHRGSMLRVKSWKICAHVLSYFSAGIDGRYRQITRFFLIHCLYHCLPILATFCFTFLCDTGKKKSRKAVAAILLLMCHSFWKSYYCVMYSTFGTTRIMIFGWVYSQGTVLICIVTTLTNTMISLQVVCNLRNLFAEAMSCKLELWEDDCKLLSWHV